MTTPRVTVPVEPEFTHYRRSQIAHLRPYVSGETLSDRVSISAADLEAGSPKPGDMIARNPDNHDDQWLVAADYFAANFEPISAAPAPEGGAVKTACVDFQEAIDDFEAEVADVMAEGSERADLWDREITVNIDALKTVMSAALATREEAPADNVTILITRAQREAAKNSGKKLNDWIGGILQRAVEEAPAEHHERNLAMTNAELIEQALSHPPLEAPAEAGEAARIIARHLPLADAPDTVCLPITMTAGDLRTVYAALRVQPPAGPTASDIAKFADANMTPEAKIKSDTAQPQAREEAQPVGWISEHVLHHMGPDGKEMIYGSKKAANYREDAITLYTTPPAPEAEKLRGAVEALEQTPAIEALTPTNREWVECVSVQDRYDLMKRRLGQALAALQAEQKGGAA